jgi:HlyD family secretion protein
MKRLVRRIAAFLFIAALIAALAYSFRPQPIAADFETVVRGSMRVTIDEEGETRIRDRFIVSASVAGRVLRIDLDPGDSVRTGETLIATFRPTQPAMLDTRSRAEAEARVQAAEAAIGRARANRDRVREELAFSESQRARYEELFEQGLIARERFDTVEFDARARREALNAAEFEVGDAEQAVAVARASLVQVTEDTASGSDNTITIRSPIDGVVLRRIRESESVVPAGEPLVEIGDVSQIEIVSDFLSEDAVRIQTGDRVLVERWGGGTTLEGLVRLVEPSGFTKLSALGVEEQRVNVVIDFADRTEAARYLGDGYRVEVRVVTWEIDDTLKAPTSSLFRTGADWSVFVVTAGVAELRTVEVGERNGLEAQILSGLSESESVIVHPSDDIEDSVEVIARGTN